MKKFLMLLITFSFITIPLPVFAAGNTYYIDAENGSDVNDGLSQEYAWKTSDKVETVTFKAGDTILFKRNQTFYGVNINISYSGSSASKITFGSYGEGERPRLVGGHAATGWELESGNVYKIPRSSTTVVPYILKINDVQIRYQKGTVTTETLQENKYFWDAEYVYYNSPDGNPDDNGLLTEMSSSQRHFNIVANKHINIENLELTISSGGAVVVDSGNSEYVTVSNCEISFIESAYSGDAGIKVSSSKNCTFKDNYIHDIFGDGIMIWNGSYCTMSGNDISRIYVGVNAGGDGIQVSGKAENYAPGNKVLNNRVSMQGTDSPKGCIIYERGNYAVISGNICLYGHFGVEADSNYGLVENNFCAYQGIEGTALNWTAGLYMSEDANITGITFRNNIVYGSKPYGFNAVKQDGSSSVKNINFYNNTIYNSYNPFSADITFNGVVKNNIFWNESPSGRIFTINNPDTNGTIEMDYNIIGPMTAGKSISYAGNVYETLSLLREITGTNLNSVTIKPDFVDPDNPDDSLKDFRLYSNSAGVDMGCNMGLTSDYHGDPSPQGNGYNMGAVETTVYREGEPPKQPDEEIEDNGPHYIKGLLAYEPFDYYPTSPLLGLNSRSSGFTGGWNDSGASVNYPAKIATGALVYEGVTPGGYKCQYVRAVSRNFDTAMTADTGTYWISLITKNTSGRGMSIKVGNKIKVEQVYGNNGNWQLRNDSDKAVTTSKGALNTVEFILFKVEKKAKDSKISLYVNPNIESGEEGLTADAYFTTNVEILLNNIVVDIDSQNTKFAEVDEIRLADNFAAAVGGSFVKSRRLVTKKIDLLSNAIKLNNELTGLPGNVTCSAYIYNAVPDSVNEKAYIYFAIYTDNEIAYLDRREVTLSEGDFGIHETEFEVPENLLQTDCTVKVMVWDRNMLNTCQNAVYSVAVPVTDETKEP